MLFSLVERVKIIKKSTGEFVLLLAIKVQNVSNFLLTLNKIKKYHCKTNEALRTNKINVSFKR